MHAALLVARLVLAGVFSLASVAKLADLRGSRATVAGFGVPEPLAYPLGTVLPLVDLAIAVALLPAHTARAGALAATLLPAVFIVAIARSLLRGEAPDCHGFGQLHCEPAGWRALARNGALSGLAAFIVVAGSGSAGPSATAWIGRLSAPGVGAIVAVALGGLTVWAMLALRRQNRRLLLRIDELEARLDTTGAPRPAALRIGLPLGEPGPPFSLSGLYGETVTLESLTSADIPVLLLFTDPRCAQSNALMPRISGWQREHAGELTIAVLTRGSARDSRANMREHGIGSVWLDDGLTVHTAYRALGTPAAVLIDARGRIASAVVAGTDAISGLVGEATRRPEVPDLQAPAPQPPPHPAPVGTPLPPALGTPTPGAVGTPAPALDLADLTGEPLALSVPDRDTLVLFWNPKCGFCQRMLDYIRAFEQSSAPGAPRLMLISSGSVAENEALRLQAPIALDATFAAGTAFGTTGTPSAVLVDRNGRVASEIATGARAVMGLAIAPSARGV